MNAVQPRMIISPHTKAHFTTGCVRLAIMAVAAEAAGERTKKTYTSAACPVLFVDDVLRASAPTAITQVEFCGVVVTRLLMDSKVVFGVDDGTGVVECVLWMPRAKAGGGNAIPVEWNAFKRASEAVDRLGRIIRVRGNLSKYQGNLQVQAKSVQRLSDGNTELVQWRDARLCREHIGLAKAAGS